MAQQQGGYYPPTTGYPYPSQPPQTAAPGWQATGQHPQPGFQYPQATQYPPPNPTYPAPQQPQYQQYPPPGPQYQQQGPNYAQTYPPQPPNQWVPPPVPPQQWPPQPPQQQTQPWPPHPPQNYAPNPGTNAQVPAPGPFPPQPTQQPFPQANQTGYNQNYPYPNTAQNPTQQPQYPYNPAPVPSQQQQPTQQQYPPTAANPTNSTTNPNYSSNQWTGQYLGGFNQTGASTQGVPAEPSQNRNSRVQATTTQTDFANPEDYILAVDPNNILGQGQSAPPPAALPAPPGPSQGSYTNSQPQDSFTSYEDTGRNRRK